MIITPRHPRPFFRSRKTILGVTFCLLILCVGHAHAQCLPGVPCIVGPTPNSEVISGDGPTAPGMPNQPKATGGGVCLPTETPAAGCACDADFMNQIYGRAWLESQRDMIKAQVLIRKPDSILEYTCFNQFNDLAVTKAAPLFSETERWTGGGLFDSLGSNEIIDTKSFALVGPPQNQIKPFVKSLLLASVAPGGGGGMGSLFNGNEMLGGLFEDLTGLDISGLGLDGLSGDSDDVEKAQAALEKVLEMLTGPNGFIGMTGPGALISGVICQPHSVPITSNWVFGWINFIPIPCVGINVYMGPDKLENSLSGLVRASLTNYINDNFGHRFLGGAATSLDYTEISGAGGYNCNFMDQVYFLSKCTDIVTDDRFWKFSDLINVDPRVLPEMCTGGTKITQDLIDLAENKDFRFVGFDQLTALAELVAQQGGSAGCTPPVPTGLITILKTYDVDSFGNVSVRTTEALPDMVCPAPNCYYTGSQCEP